MALRLVAFSAAAWADELFGEIMDSCGNNGNIYIYTIYIFNSNNNSNNNDNNNNDSNNDNNNSNNNNNNIIHINNNNII